ncbi:hypothetical protein NPIL_636341 [Nephila pilipes]|uniref:Uncharacterized protein n=1 Tax=Nephila pilipes TaxID=299642 RepID=A0A8X6Q3X4_NEPPI|nr:hypothetical protein NPIL_636341 [Nephila pilipes]
MVLSKMLFQSLRKQMWRLYITQCARKIFGQMVAERTFLNIRRGREKHDGRECERKPSSPERNVTHYLSAPRDRASVKDGCVVPPLLCLYLAERINERRVLCGPVPGQRSGSSPFTSGRRILISPPRACLFAQKSVMCAH